MNYPSTISSTLLSALSVSLVWGVGSSALAQDSAVPQSTVDIPAPTLRFGEPLPVPPALSASPTQPNPLLRQITQVESAGFNAPLYGQTPEAAPDAEAEAPPPETTPSETEEGVPVESTELEFTPTPEAAPGVEDGTTFPESQPESAGDPRVFVAEVRVDGVDGHPQADELRELIYDAIETRPNEPTSRQQLENDLNAIFATGLFRNVEFLPQDTPLGVSITFIATPNPTLTRVQVEEGTRILPPDLVEETFSPYYGQTLNFQDLQDGIQTINQWYQENGYVLGQVVDAQQVTADGVVTLAIAEGEVADVQVNFVDEFGENVEKGKTKPYIILREFSLKPGDIFNRNQSEGDIQRVFGLGIFEDVQLSLNPSPEDPRKVIVVANVTEGRTGSIGAGAGVSSATGLFGSISYQQQNFRGRNYTLGTDLTLGFDALLFNVNFSNPWIKGDPYRTSYNVNAFRRRSISLVFDGGERDVDLPNGDTPRIVRTGGGVTFNRPLSKDVYNPSVWTASAGLEYQRVNIQDSDGESSTKDELGNDLTFSGGDADDLLILGLGLSRDLRNNRLQPTAGSIARVGLDQSVPLGQGSIFMSRVRGSYSYYIPMRFVRFSQGCRKADPSPTECPQTLAFNIQGGTVLGDLPPYEAFTIGGSNSVRGYKEGEIGAGRSFIQATAEYRFPLFALVGGAIFADVGTDLGSSGGVPGNPAEARQKPGSGFGIGLGARIRSPLGAIRVDYGFNDQGDGRLHFGIGERF